MTTPLKEKKIIINLGEYKEDNFSNKEAMSEEIENDTVRVMEAQKKSRRETIKEMVGEIDDSTVEVYMREGKEVFPADIWNEALLSLKRKFLSHLKGGDKK
jgi:hypothetical protein